MTRYWTEAEVYEAIGAYRTPEDRRQAHQTTVPTETPGVFYHGSPSVNISDFRTTHVRRDGRAAAALYMTENPTLAALHAAHGSSGMGGRIYKFELVTRKALFRPAGDWLGDEQVDLYREIQDIECEDARLRGHDAIVSGMFDGTILEVIALQDDVIKSLDGDVKRLREWTSPKAFEALTFFEAENLAEPDDAPGCVMLFGKPKAAAELGVWRKVLVDAINPIYCERDIWPLMDFAALRFADIECLVDPHHRCALLLEPSKITPMNRAIKRALQSEWRRHWRARR